MTLEEIRDVLKEYNSGPIVKKAALEALAWAELYRDLLIKYWKLPPIPDESVRQLIGTEARRIKEGK